MGEQTNISWTTHTWNPWWGCEKISPACDHCYAESTANRYGFKIWGQDSERRFFGDKHWNEPLRWDKVARAAGVHRRVFCSSMSDIMEDRPDLVEPRERAFGVIEKTRNLDWLLLTKRPENLQHMLPNDWARKGQKNVWLMTTVEDQDYVWRARFVSYYEKFPVRGLSVEPLLGRVTLDEFCLRRINWVIVGVESGHKARTTNMDHVNWLRDQCAKHGIAFFTKQLIVDGKLTKDIAKFPKDLQIQEFPHVTR